VRKFLAQSVKADFSARLAALRDEGFHLPVSSRLLGALKAVGDRIDAATALASPGLLADEQAEAGTQGRRSSGSSKHRGPLSAALSAALVARVLGSAACPQSSDEEQGPSPQQARGDGSLVVAGVRFSREQLAPLPRLAWPPNLPAALAPSPQGDKQLSAASSPSDKAGAGEPSVDLTSNIL